MNMAAKDRHFLRPFLCLDLMVILKEIAGPVCTICPEAGKVS